MYVFAVHLMDRDLAADMGPPFVWLGPRVALRGRKKQDVAAEPSRHKSSCEPTVLFHDLDDCCNLMLLDLVDPDRSKRSVTYMQGNLSDISSKRA